MRDPTREPMRKMRALIVDDVIDVAQTVAN